MKLWIDDIRPAPRGYFWVKSVNQAIDLLKSSFNQLNNKTMIEVIDLDHDAGDYTNRGGDYIEILKWLEAEEFYRGIPYIPFIHIHSKNPVGISNMRAIIRHDNWKEV